MPERRFLLWLLTGIFIWQACTFAAGLSFCLRQGSDINTTCPEIGKRYEATFAVMITTTLALLTGGDPKQKP